MIFIIIILNESMLIKLNYYSLTKARWLMKLKLKMCIKTFGITGINSVDYPEQSPYFDETNKKVVGKFKDETVGIPVVEFVGWRSKMYSYIKDNDKGDKTAKGIKKNFIKKNIKHEDYKNVLFNNQ